MISTPPTAPQYQPAHQLLGEQKELFREIPVHIDHRHEKHISMRGALLEQCRLLEGIVGDQLLTKLVPS